MASASPPLSLRQPITESDSDSEASEVYCTINLSKSRDTTITDESGDQLSFELSASEKALTEERVSKVLTSPSVVVPNQERLCETSDSESDDECQDSTTVTDLDSAGGKTGGSVLLAYFELHQH